MPAATIGDDFDHAILRALRMPGDPSDPLGPRWLETAAIDVTSLGSHSVLVILVAVVSGVLILRGHRGRALQVLVAATGSALISFTLKLLFDRPRPAIVDHLVTFSTASFPSGHALVSAGVYLTLGAILGEMQASRGARAFIYGAAATIVFIVGLSRIYLGVHWPSDVLAGWCIGTAWAMACWTIAHRWPAGSR